MVVFADSWSQPVRTVYDMSYTCIEYCTGTPRGHTYVKVNRSSKLE